MTPGLVLRWIVFASLMILVSGSGKSQDTITIEFGCQQVAVGDQICVPVTVDGYVNVTTFSLLLTWDPLVLEFTGLQNQHYAGGAWFTPGPSDFRYLWSDVSGNGNDLPDGTLLFDICFEAIGAPGTSSIITVPEFALNPFNPTEFANPDAELIPYADVPCDIEVINPVTVVGLIESCGSPDGVSDGTFTITAAGGTSPYTYNWTGPVNGSSVLPAAGSSESQSVPPGNYTITITDNAGGSQMYMITVDSDGLESLITIIREVTCYDFSNGRIEVGAFNGSHPIRVIWKNLLNAPYNGSGYLNAPGDAYLLNSLPVGQYAITLIDEAGCETRDTVTLSADPIVVNAQPVNASCLGAADGSVMLTFSGGRPFNGGIYRIRPSWGGSVQSTSPLNTPPILEAGDYWVEVGDSINNCNDTAFFTIGADIIISADLLITPPSCAGVNDAMLRIAGLTDGVLGMSYDFQVFNSSLNLIHSTANSAITFINDLAPGNYFLVVMEGVCRSDTISIEIPVTEVIAIDLLSVTPSGCIQGQSNGSIKVQASGGTPNYTYSWDGGLHMGSMVSGLVSGNHFLTVTDANGCTGQLVVNVPQATGPMIIDIVASNIGCTGGDATLEVIYSEGSSPVSEILWSTGDTTPVITGVNPGNVNVTIRDSLFCFDIASFNVPDEPYIQVDSVILEDPTCAGDADGMFSVFVSAGTEPYTYTWSTGLVSNFNVLAGLTAGTYSVTVTGSDTCNVMIDTTIVLSDPIAPQFDFTAIDSTTCSNTCDGAATLVPTGGVPGFDYTFLWDTGLMETGTQSTAQDLCPGYQRVVITQDNLCYYEDSVFVPYPDPVGMDTLLLENASCYGSADGSIAIEGNGGTGPYSYLWSVPGAGSMQSNLVSGMYLLTITDDNGCTSESEFTITEPDTLVLSIDSTALHPISCTFANSGSIAVQVDGGNGGYMFTWDPNVSDGYVANNIGAGEYHITVTDELGCTDTTSVLLTGPAPVMGFLPMINDPVCFGDLAEVTVDSAIGGNGGYTWSINGGAQLPLDSVANVPAGIYNIITQDSTGCRDTVQVILNNPPPIEIAVLPDAPVIELGDSIKLEVFIAGSQIAPDSVVWTPTGTLSCNDCTEPVASNVIPTVYSVTVWDENGCSASTEVLVEVDNSREVYVPNVFSPNFDGFNDDFVIHIGRGIIGIPGIRIFNRWGELMHEMRDVPVTLGEIAIWDGTFNNKMMLPGVYVYMIEIRFADNQVLTYRGDVTLVR